MNYIVMDLEFNQPFDFKKNAKKKPNPEIPFEIIQIGCVKLNEKFEKIDGYNVLIKPIVYKRIHPFVQKITGFNQGALSAGDSFENAYLKLSKFVDEESVFCVWGDVDLKLLFKNIEYFKLDSAKMPTKYINVQKLASKKLEYGSGRMIGLKNAIELFEIEIKEQFHDAYNDALYTSLVLEKLEIENDSILNYQFERKNKKTEKTQNNKVDFANLYNYVEKELGRKLTSKEKRVYRNVFLLGSSKKSEKNLLN